MKRLIRSGLGCGLFLVATVAFGQGDKGSIAGTVKDPVGGIVAGAAVQATNSATGAVHKATSSKQGAYTLADLPEAWRTTPRNAPCPCGSGKKFKYCHGRLA